MRVALQEGTIHERPRVALVGIADQIARLSRTALADLPLEAGGKAGTASAPQPAALDIFDDLVGIHAGQCLGSGLVHAALDRSLDSLRVDPAHIAQHLLGLMGIERDIPQMRHVRIASVAEPPDDLAAHHGLGEHIRYVFDPVTPVDDVVGLDHGHRSHRAQTVATRLYHLDLVLQAGCIDFRPKCGFDFSRPDRQAAGRAHQNPAAPFGAGGESISQRSQVVRGQNLVAVVTHRVPPLLILAEDLADLVGIDASEIVVIHHHYWSQETSTDTGDGLEREASVLGRLPGAYPEFFVDRLLNDLTASYVASRTATDADGMSTVFFEIKLGVEGGHAVEVAGWDAGPLAHLEQHLAGKIPVALLDRLEQGHRQAMVHRSQIIQHCECGSEVDGAHGLTPRDRRITNASSCLVAAITA